MDLISTTKCGCYNTLKNELKLSPIILKEHEIIEIAEMLEKFRIE